MMGIDCLTKTKMTVLYPKFLVKISKGSVYIRVLASILGAGIAFYPLSLKADHHTDIVENVLISSLDCVVTAYYQPLPSQNNLLQGNFAAEVAMNGDDTTASGTKVALGTVAAPPEYPFGTIVDIGGFGIGEVRDRGGAIKNNRFDIWVGKGDEGLARAANWGKRTTSCTVYLPGSVIPDEVKAQMGKYNLPSAVLPADFWLKKQSFGHKNLSLGSDGDDVKEVQEILKALGYQIVVNGIFDELLAETVIDFQVKKKIIVNKESDGAGMVGPRTWQALLATSSETKSNPVLIPTKVAEGQKITIDLAYGAEGSEVSKLQENLRLLGYFDNPTITDYFGPATQAAVIRFQLAEKMIANDQDARAGMLDKKTRERLLAVLFGKQEPSPIPFTVLKKGNRGPEVKILQERLTKAGAYTGPFSEYFGVQTEKAISDFQKKYALDIPADEEGVFNQRTAIRLDQALGLDISLSPVFTRYIEQFSLIKGTLKKGI